ncbi:MAG: hypothetical protein IKH20_11810 [Clostridiales bacterium]|nr:hypothetical protein [Clostridiales bacterium]
MDLTKTVNNLLLTASFSLAIGLTLFVNLGQVDRSKLTNAVENAEKVDDSEIRSPNRHPNPAILEETELRNIWQDIGIEYITPEFDYIGQHFITAYSPEECGYRIYEDGTDNFPNGWITSTGTIAHREEEWWNPSTCGIATDYHRYGELFLIDGKIYKAEDTGYISGAWIDLFMPDYETMMQFGSHYTDVYSVEYVSNSLTKEERKINHEHFDDYLHGRCYGDRIPYRCDR